jgi:hypothetical protein
VKQRILVVAVELLSIGKRERERERMRGGAQIGLVSCPMIGKEIEVVYICFVLFPSLKYTFASCPWNLFCFYIRNTRCCSSFFLVFLCLLKLLID